MSFSANDYADGNLYNILGFCKSSTLPPDYKYAGCKTGNKRMHKSGFSKSKIKTSPKLSFVENKTERELAEMNHLYRIYDSGKIRWVKDI